MLPLLLFLSFLAVPVLEIYVILQIGGLIGTWLTVAVLVADSVLGAWIVRREGLRAWRSVQQAMLAGAVPDRALADAALILVGGALLLTPGFVTDAFGFAMVLPFTRPAVRAALSAYARRRLYARVASSTAAGTPSGYDGPTDGGHQRVVRGDIIDHDE